MKFNEAREILYAQFNTNWSLTPPVPFAFDNEAFDSEGLDEFAILRVRQTGGGQHTLGESGNRVFRRRGTVSVQLHVAVDSGLQRMDAMAEAVLDILEAKTISQVSLYDGDYRELGPLDGYARGLVSVAFDFDEIK